MLFTMTSETVFGIVAEPGKPKGVRIRTAHPTTARENPANALKLAQLFRQRTCFYDPGEYPSKRPALCHAQPTAGARLCHCCDPGAGAGDWRVQQRASGA